MQEQWLVSHHEDRHRPEVRRVAERIVGLMQRHAGLFQGDLAAAAASARA
jgi:hypothetical protein